MGRQLGVRSRHAVGLSALLPPGLPLQSPNPPPPTTTPTSQRGLIMTAQPPQLQASWGGRGGEHIPQFLCCRLTGHLGIVIRIDSLSVDFFFFFLFFVEQPSMDEAWILLLSGHLASWIQTPPECLSFHFPRAKGNNHDDRKYIRKEARPFDGLKMRALKRQVSLGEVLRRTEPRRWTRFKINGCKGY